MSRFEQIRSPFITHGVMKLHRSPQTIAALMNARFEGKRVMLYGGGSHTRELLPHLQHGVHVSHIIEDHPHTHTFEQIPVIPADSEEIAQTDAIVISSSQFAFEMQHRLLERGVASDKIFNFYDISYRNHYDFDALPTLPLHHSDKPNLLLVTPFENADHITRAAPELSHHFDLHKCYYLHTHTVGDDAHFTSMTDLYGSLYYLDHLIAKDPAAIDLVIVNVVPSTYHVPVYLKQRFPHLNVVISMLDVLSFFGPKAKIADDLEFYGRYDFELQCESDMLESVDGVIASMDGEDAERLLANTRRKIIHYNHLPAAIMRFDDHPLHAPARLCYAGGVLPSGKNKAISEDIKMIRVARPLLSQGFELDLYFTRPRDATFDRDFDDYLALEASTPRLRLHGFHTEKALLPKIAQADFGLMVYDFSTTRKLGVIKQHLKAVMPTKVFTYLAAGLPILISEELETAARYVRDHHVGIVVRQSDIAHLDRLLTSCDYAALKQNVRTHQRHHDMESHAPILEAFLQGATS